MDLVICLRLEFHSMEQRKFPFYFVHIPIHITCGCGSIFDRCEIRLNGYVFRAQNIHIRPWYTEQKHTFTTHHIANQHIATRRRPNKLFISHTCNMISSTIYILSASASNPVIVDCIQYQFVPSFRFLPFSVCHFCATTQPVSKNFHMFIRRFF